MKQFFEAFSQERQGEFFMAGAIILFAWAPILTVVLTQSLSIFYILGMANLWAAGFFALWLTMARRWHEFKTLRHGWSDLLLATAFITLFYLLIFWGQSLTSPTNGAILALSQIVFSFFILGFWGHESFSREAYIGTILMLIGAAIVLFPGQLSLNLGDLIIILSFAIPPLSNIFAKRARSHFRTKQMLFIRCLITGLFLLPLSYIGGQLPSYEIFWGTLALVAFFGIFIFGIEKVFWTEAMHRISITKCSTLTTFGPILTMFYVFVLYRDIPTIWQIGGLIPMVLGTLILLYKDEAFKVLKR